MSYTRTCKICLETLFQVANENAGEIENFQYKSQGSSDDKEIVSASPIYDSFFYAISTESIVRMFNLTAQETSLLNSTILADV